MSKTFKNSVSQQDKFKMNLLQFFLDMNEIYEPRGKIQLANYCELVGGLAENQDSKFLITNFINEIEKIRENDLTLLEYYAQGHYFSLLIKFVNSLPLAEGVLKEEDLDLLDDNEKDTLVDYIKSFFKIVENYKKENVERN